MLSQLSSNFVNAPGKYRIDCITSWNYYFFDLKREVNSHIGREQDKLLGRLVVLADDEWRQGLAGESGHVTHPHLSQRPRYTVQPSGAL